MKIILIGPLPPPPSGQAVSFAMLVRFIQNKYKTAKVLNIASKFQPSTSSSLQVVIRFFEYIGILLYFFYSILGGADRVYITISQSRLGFWRDFVFITASYILGIEVIVHLKGGNYKGFFENSSPIKQYFIRSTLSKVGTIIVLSERLRNMFNFDPRLSCKLKVVKNGFIEAQSVPPVIVQPGTPLQIIFLSNLIQSKGYLQLIDAVKLLIDAGKEVNLKLAGSFMPSIDDSKDLFYNSVKSEKDLLDYIGPGYDISYVGVVEGKAKWELLKNAHVMVLPTSYIYEGQPVSIIEGIAYGLPIVATQYKAIPDMVSAYNGILLQKTDPEEIARAINTFFDVNILNDMRKNSYKLYQEQFTMDKHLRNLLNTINNSGSPTI